MAWNVEPSGEEREEGFRPKLVCMPANLERQGTNEVCARVGDDLQPNVQEKFRRFGLIITAYITSHNTEASTDRPTCLKARFTPRSVSHMCRSRTQALLYKSEHLRIQ